MTNEVAKKATNKGLKNLSSKDTANVLIKMIEAKREYETVREQEITKRYEIESDLKKYILKLSNQREIIENSLEKEYSMCRETIDKMFSYVDRALDEGKDEIVIAALDNIEGIVKESPLAGLAKITKAFENDNVDLEI